MKYKEKKDLLSYLFVISVFLFPFSFFITKDKKNQFFRSIFGEKLVFGGAGKDFRVEKLSAKNSGKIVNFLAKNRKYPMFSEIWGKLCFRSLRREKLKNGAKQSCRIKKKYILGKIIHVWCIDQPS